MNAPKNFASPYLGTYTLSLLLEDSSHSELEPIQKYYIFQAQPRSGIQELGFQPFNFVATQLNLQQPHCEKEILLAREDVEVS